MHIEIVGRGSPLVMLHGWAMHSGVFAPLIEGLAEHHQLHLVDLPGHGHSPERGDDIDLAAAVPRILDATPPAPWLGWSMGGLLALQAAAERPERVNGLIAIAASPRFVRGPDWPLAVSAEIFEQFADELGRDYRRTLERFLTLETIGSEHSREALKQLRDCAFARGEPAQAALLQGLALLAHQDLRPQLAALGVPSLWLAGRRDRLVPPNAMRAAAELNPKAQFHCIEGAGHAPFLSHVEETLAAVLGFVDGLE